MNSPVFNALSRPAQFLGVDYDYFLLNGLVSMLFFIFSGSFFSVLIFLPLHFLGWMLCRIDPFIFKLISVSASIGSVRNKRIWGCQSYEVF